MLKPMRASTQIQGWGLNDKEEQKRRTTTNMQH